MIGTNTTGLDRVLIVGSLATLYDAQLVLLHGV